MIARTTWTRLVVLGLSLSLGLAGLLLGCGGSTKSKQNKCPPKPKPPPPSLKGCQTQVRLPWTAHRGQGIDVQTEVKLRLVKEAVRAVVVHRLTVKDQATHWIHDPSHAYNVHDIPNPMPAPVSDDCDSLEGSGRLTRVLTSAALKLAPGKPLKLSAEPDNALLRGKRLEVVINASLSGDPKHRPVVPTVDVRVGWTGCPTVKLRATKPPPPAMK